MQTIMEALDLRTFELDPNAVLCYVEGSMAYFTTQPLSEQWGDDWNDAPYEHNAGAPYPPFDGDRAAGRDWRIYQVAFEKRDMDAPCDGQFNSPYSVEQINCGAVPWLAADKWASHRVNIMAGTTLAAFIEAIQTAGGTVYLPIPR